MTPFRFRFTEKWLSQSNHYNDSRFSGDWYLITRYNNGTCYFRNNLGQEDGIWMEVFLLTNNAEFQYEETIVDKILTKYQNEV